MSQQAFNSYNSAKVSAQLVCPNCQHPLATGATACVNCGRIITQNNFADPDNRPTQLAIPEVSTEQVPYGVATPLPTGEPRLDKFEVVQTLSSSPDGINTYLARYDSTDKLFVLKEVETDTPQHAALLQTFQILQNIADEAIPAPFTTFELADHFYTAYGYISGQSLAGYWHGATEAARLQVIQQLCRLVAKINQQGAVVLDIRPEFLVIDTAGRLALQDVPRLYRLPLSQNVPGSYYLAPEIYLAPGDVSIRADVYAIGAVWLALLSGGTLTAAHLREGQPGLRGPGELGLSPPPWPALHRLVSRAVEPALDKRYKTALILRDAIAQAETELSEVLLAQAAPQPQLAAWSDIGQRRDNDEDTFFAENIETAGHDFTLLLVADGMGGEKGGEVASDIVKSEVTNRLWQSLSGMSRAFEEQGIASNVGAVDKALQTIFEQVATAASRAIWEKAQQDSDLRGMGSTLVVAVIESNRARIANVGDSRAYLIRPGRDGQAPFILQLTEDHTRLAEMRRTGQSVSEQDETRWQGILSRNLGFQPEAQIALTVCDLLPGDFLLLCCDGLTDALTDQQILSIVLNSPPDYLQYINWQLINAANTASGHDNITTAIYRQ